VSHFVWENIPETSRQKILAAVPNSDAQQFALATNLNTVLKDAAFYDAARFAGLTLREQTQKLLPEKLEGAKLIYRNRLLLEDAFPESIQRSHFTPKGLLWLNLVLFGVIGFFVYVPVMFSGVVALDLTSKKAQATAAGFVGFFGYVGGRVIQAIGLGWLAQNYGWDASIYAIIACIVLGIVLLSFLWNVKPRG